MRGVVQRELRGGSSQSAQWGVKARARPTPITATRGAAGTPLARKTGLAASVPAAPAPPTRARLPGAGNTCRDAVASMRLVPPAPREQAPVYCRPSPGPAVVWRAGGEVWRAHRL